MNQFKEIIFARLKREAPKGTGNSDNQLNKAALQELRVILRKIINWSECIDRYQKHQIFMNFQNKSIYNNGIIINELDSNNFEVEVLTCVPEQTSISIKGTIFEHHKNFINYNFQKTMFFSNPIHLFETIGYQIQNNFEFKDVEYFRSYTYGIEVLIYPKHGYIQLIQSFQNKKDADNGSSMINCILKQIKNCLQVIPQVNISMGNMRPQDFTQEYS